MPTKKNWRRKFTDKFIVNAKPPKAGRIEWTDTLEPGLAFRITEDGRRTYALRLWTGPADRRVQRRVRLGHPRDLDGSPVLTLAQARKSAREVKQLAAEGKALTPGDAISKGAFTFEKLAAKYLEWAKDTKRPRTVDECGRMLRSKDFDAWRDRPATSITADDVRALRDRIHERGAAVLATRALRFVGALGSWAVSEGKLAASPAQGVRPRTTETARDRTLHNAEIAAFFKACDTFDFPFRDMLKLLALSGQRLREVAEMEWNEVSLDRREWVIAARRTKNGNAHTVHLSDPALAILTALAEQRAKIGMLQRSRFVFSTTGTTPISGFSRSKERLDAAMAKLIGHEIPAFTLHDLRRTATTKMAELGFPPHVVDKILNHSAGAIRGTAAVYNRHQYLSERQAALETFGRFITSLTEPSANVVPLARGGKPLRA
jgi:integrase